MPAAKTFLTADDVALKFCTRQDGTVTTNRGWWLSQKQTSWLMRTFHADAQHMPTDDPRHKLPAKLAVGRMANGADWSCRVSPVNGCGWFAVGKDAETITQEYVDERAARVEELRAIIASYKNAIAALAEHDTEKAQTWARLVGPQLEKAERELEGLENPAASLRRAIADLAYLDQPGETWTEAQRDAMRRTSLGYLRTMREDYRQRLVQIEAGQD